MQQISAWGRETATAPPFAAPDGWGLCCHFFRGRPSFDLQWSSLPFRLPPSSCASPPPGARRRPETVRGTPPRQSPKQKPQRI